MVGWRKDVSMMRWGSIRIAALSGVLGAPLAAWADPSGSVTTEPIQQAPALAMPVLVLLAVALTAITMYRLRHTRGGRIAGVGLIVVVLAGIGYAGLPTITIMDADCAKQTVSVFNPLDEETLLTSDCTNRLRVTDIQKNCELGVVSPDTGGAPVVDEFAECFVGEVLAHGDTCALLGCKR